MYKLILAIGSILVITGTAIGQASDEVRALIDSTRQYYYLNGDKTIGFARQALILARAEENFWGEHYALQMMGEGHFTLGNMDSANYYYDQALALAVKEGDVAEQAHDYISKASIAQQAGEYADAIAFYKTGIQLQEEVGDTSSLCDAHLRLGNVYSSQGNHILAIENFFVSIRLCEAADNLTMVGYNYGAIAIVYEKQKNFDDAEKYYQSGIEVFDEIENDFGIAGLRNNMGIMYKNMGLYDKAIENYRLSLEKFEKVGYKPGIMAGNGNLGILSVRKNEHEAAMRYAETALSLAIETGNPESQQDNLNTLANANLGIGNYSVAIDQAEQSLSMAQDLGSLEKLQDVHLTLSKIYESLGQTDLALNYFKEYKVYTDSMLNEEQSRQITELQTVYETEKKDQEIEILAKNAEIDQVKKTRLWIGLGLTLLLAGLVIYNLWQRRVKDRRIYEQQQEIERQKRLNTELENARLESELEFKQKELTAKVLQLARKNDFLQGLDEQVHKLRDQSEGEVKDEARKLSRMINRDVETETDWDDFLASFKQVHSDFIRRLSTEYPDLSKNDHKLACLMKMNLSSKEIASALNISPAGIKKARHRLRKKLDLPTEQNIQEFFICFPGKVDITAKT